MFNRENLDGIAMIAKANAVRADAQAKLWRIDIFKSLYVALFGPQETRQSLKYPHRSFQIDSANLGFSPWGPSNLFCHRLSIRPIVFHRKRLATHSLEVFQG
jgi:hypothetical protein